MVVEDGREHQTYQGISVGTLTFSPDSRRLAYAAKKDYRWIVVCDGQEGEPYSAVGRFIDLFSPDSHHLAYAVLIGSPPAMIDGKYATSKYSKQMVEADGIEGKPYDAGVEIA